ncbi:hypothetical protein P5X00_35530 [Paraburkholderia sp. A2RO-4L]|uniref:hypothetical protein n=1 Tax=Paraburkholderia sp. A2RO-4L TaxID=3028374 RepID=UPI0032F71FB9|nr:hypothetical protein [Burkholderia vietnamiensis]
MPERAEQEEKRKQHMESVLDAVGDVADDAFDAVTSSPAALEATGHIASHAFTWLAELGAGMGDALAVAAGYAIEASVGLAEAGFATLGELLSSLLG